jgi:hypothetical protein
MMKVDRKILTIQDLAAIAVEYRYADVREVAQAALRLLKERNPRPPKADHIKVTPASWK